MAASSPRLDAEVLLCHITKWTKTELHCRINDPIKQGVKREFEELVQKRETGLPVAYLTGWKDFFSRRFQIQPGVLVPRPETETLVEEALALLRRSPGATRILDLCCGSGCIGITLALETLSSTVTLSDVCDQALRQSEENKALFGVSARVEIQKSDLFSSLPRKAFDLIVSNPPYVGTEFGPEPDPEVLAHEPRRALFSGPHGTEILRKIIKEAPLYLIEGGSLIMECASFQAETVEAWMSDRGYDQTGLWHDLSGLPRGVSGRWEG